MELKVIPIEEVGGTPLVSSIASAPSRLPANFVGIILLISRYFGLAIPIYCYLCAYNLLRQPPSYWQAPQIQSAAFTNTFFGIIRQAISSKSVSKPKNSILNSYI